MLKYDSTQEQLDIILEYLDKMMSSTAKIRIISERFDDMDDALISVALSALCHVIVGCSNSLAGLAKAGDSISQLNDERNGETA